VFSGGSYEEVTRWLQNFVLSHAKRESPRLEAVVEAEGEREGKSYGVRLRLGDRLLPPQNSPPIELAYPEVAEGKGSLGWCEALAKRVRSLARDLLDTESNPPLKTA
jgi:hypothetical protein